MTSTTAPVASIAEQHFPGEQPRLLAATHAWRCVLRQASAYLAGLVDAAGEPVLRAALRDTVAHLDHACALLTDITLLTDPRAPEARRGCASTHLTRRSR